ncbi:hypothetical protein B7R22_14490 [Subtercola boreus]|uniref:HTH cro/C1-type domain-containing protein n=1 Tax=Subtercola boreus TaxID=120213 RepID=A0A3E0VSJ4_9MICO|nr:helix-turn-helix transcriptional regulator [Subtercola boreus]RFA12856.1 hypothetical protein B7R22_14490 [Subtercola boreus]
MDYFVTQLLETSGLTAVALAARSGVSRSTLFRIDRGQTDSRTETLRELAIAAGFDLTVATRPLSDPDAGRAARVLLDGRYDLPPDQSVTQWIHRLGRLAGIDPVDIVRVAGVSSSLIKRTGAVFLTGEADDLKLAAAGENSGKAWILSGRGALEQISSDQQPLPGTARVLYAEDVHRVVRSLDHLVQGRPERADVIVAPLTDDLGIDALVAGRLRYVAPIQALIDGFGLGGSAANVAADIAGSW